MEKENGIKLFLKNGVSCNHRENRYGKINEWGEADDSSSSKLLLFYAKEIGGQRIRGSSVDVSMYKLNILRR